MTKPQTSSSANCNRSPNDSLDMYMHAPGTQPKSLFSYPTCLSPHPHWMHLLSAVSPLLSKIEWDVSVLDHVPWTLALSTSDVWSRECRLTGSACALSNQRGSRSRSTRLASRQEHRSPWSMCTKERRHWPWWQSTRT
jgi:hypothetical protein